MTSLTPHQQAALDLSRHISLTANAGSGKTFVLSKRYLEIALNENIPLRNIAAITFTEKAAGELYKKISTEVDKLVLVETDKTTLRKLENIRRQLVSANISTIHSFCIDILREYPVEADLDANFTPIDQTTSDELIELAIEEIIKELMDIPEESEDLKSLIRLFSSKMKLFSEISNLVLNRKNVLETAGYYNRTPQETADFFYQSFLKNAEDIISPEIQNFIFNVQIINDTVLKEKKSNQIAIEVRHLLDELKKSVNIESSLKILKLISDELCTNAGTIKKTGYLRGESRDSLSSEVARVEQFLHDLSFFVIPDEHSEIELELANTGKKIFSLFLKCTDRYELKKKDEGFLDYEDLLLYTKKILENSQVQLSLSEKFKYIMVDEYQDTNEIQYRIFLPILDYLKKNNLFVVGDEKQSIYMFRDAELEVFTRTNNDITISSGKKLSLPDSFRMAPALCLFSNTVFKNLFSDPQPAFNEVAHSDIICARETDIKGDVEILITPKEEKDDEADLISRRLMNLVQEEPPKYKWGDIAILCRKRKSFSGLEEAFTRYQIPFRIIGGKGFYQRQSVYDVYNYFSFLLDTQNDASLAGILRSPFFSMSDAVLYQISLLYGNSFWEKVKSFSIKDDQISEIIKLLEQNILLSRNYDLTFLLRKILNETGYFAVLASGLNGEQETANINKLIRLTTNFFAHGYKTLYDYVNFLKDAIASEEDEAQAAVSDESDSVKIMTIHQAKGLEYPVVVLYKSNETSKSTSAKSKEISVDKNFGLLTKVPLRNDYFRSYVTAPVVNLSCFINKKKSTAEIKRLFYVAVTRAKDLLIISSILPGRAKEDSFTGLLMRGLNIDLESSGHTISSSLKYLIKDDESFKTKEERLELKIHIIREIKEAVMPEKGSDTDDRDLVMDLTKINDLPSGEIISATKYSVYKECPVKYNLIYEYGFSELFNSAQKEKMIEIVPDEEDNGSGEEVSPSKKYADTKGSIIHRILQQEVLPDELLVKGSRIIENELKNLNIVPEFKELITHSIIKDLQGYFNSEVFSRIRNETDYRNEYNVYLKEQDYYLYGIIDKLVLNGASGTIIDYKTDDIKEEELSRRSAKYFNQLKFYSYIIKSAFKKLAEIELRLVFIKHPGKNVSLVLSPDQINLIGADISKMVREIRLKEIVKNYDHCRSCHFFIDKTGCIIL